MLSNSASNNNRVAPGESLDDIEEEHGGVALNNTNANFELITENRMASNSNKVKIPYMVRATNKQQAHAFGGN